MGRSVSDILAAYRPPEVTVQVVTDGGLVARIGKLQEEIRRARARDARNGDTLAAEAPALEAQMPALLEEAEQAVESFTFRAIGRAKLADITRRYPPSHDQWERYKEASRVNPLMAGLPEFDYEAAAPELLAASAVDPVMTVEEARTICAEWHDAAVSVLIDAAWEVNQQAPTRPTFGTGIATTRSSGPESTTQQNGESPSPSSLAGS